MVARKYHSGLLARIDLRPTVHQRTVYTTGLSCALRTQRVQTDSNKTCIACIHITLCVTTKLCTCLHPMTDNPAHFFHPSVALSQNAPYVRPRIHRDIAVREIRRDVSPWRGLSGYTDNDWLVTRSTDHDLVSKFN